MIHHDDTAGDPHSRSAKRKTLPPAKRIRIALCEVGDTAELGDGRRCVVTGHLNNGTFGRWLSPEGREGEFGPLDGALACVRVDGYR